MAGETFEQMSGISDHGDAPAGGRGSLVRPVERPAGAEQACRLPPALAFGNTCVLKPSEHTPLSSFAHGVAARRGGPAGQARLM